MSKEAEYNRLFEKVISYSPFGNWYPLMKAASNFLTKKLPKQVGINKKTGQPIIVYRGNFGKILGAYATPTHEHAAKSGGGKKGLKGLVTAGLDLLTGGQPKFIIEQLNAEVFDLSPEEVEHFWKTKTLLKPIGGETVTNKSITGSSAVGKAVSNISTKINVDPTKKALKVKELIPFIFFKIRISGKQLKNILK